MVSKSATSAKRQKLLTPNFVCTPAKTRRRDARIDLRLDVGDGRVGCGEAVFAGDAVGADERQVDDELGEHPRGPVVDGGERASADAAAEQQDGGGGRVGEQGGGAERRGHHGQGAVGRQRLGDQLRAVPLVDVDRLGVAEQPGRGGRDAPLLHDPPGRAGLERRLETRGLDRVGAAVGTPDEAVLLQLAQVAPDGLRSDAQLGGELERRRPHPGCGRGRGSGADDPPRSSVRTSLGRPRSLVMSV